MCESDECINTQWRETRRGALSYISAQGVCEIARPVRRVKFNIGLTYETTPEQIKAIVFEIQEMINKHKDTNQEGKVRFQEFGSSSLDILIVYFVQSPKWETLINVKEDINYKIMEIVKRNKSDFAFPSTTVYLNK